MPERKKLTISDIAKQTGVSKATVSRILNGKPDVAPETRERVFRVIEEARYAPSATATRLTKRKANLIGLLLPSLSWPWVLEVIRGITEHIEENEYELILFTATTPEKTKKLFDKTVASGFADGLIAVLPPDAAPLLSQAYADGYPLVLIDDRVVYSTDFPTVSVINTEGAYQAVSYLISRGHRDIACMTGPMDLLCNQERFAGYRLALEEAGIAFHQSYLIDGDFTETGGYHQTQHLLSLPNPPTAIFATNDLMALGTIEAAKMLGRQIPQDLAVIGFDDIPQAAYASLTTVHQPMYEMGRSAVDLLIAQIEQQPLEQTRLQLETRFIVRASSG